MFVSVPDPDPDAPPTASIASENTCTAPSHAVYCSSHSAFASKVCGNGEPHGDIAMGGIMTPAIQQAVEFDVPPETLYELYHGLEDTLAGDGRARQA